MFALFNLLATPEPSAHIAFVDALKSVSGTRHVVSIVDEAPFLARAQGDARRVEERRAAWQTLFAEHGRQPVFVNLDAPDLEKAQAAIEAQMGGVK